MSTIRQLSLTLICRAVFLKEGSIRLYYELQSERLLPILQQFVVRYLIKCLAKSPVIVVVYVATILVNEYEYI